MSYFKSVFSAVADRTWRRLISHDHSYGVSESSEAEYRLNKSGSADDADSLDAKTHTEVNSRSESKLFKKPRDRKQKFETGNENDVAVFATSRDGRGIINEGIRRDVFDDEFDERISINDDDDGTSDIANGPDIHETQTEANDTDMEDETNLGEFDVGSEDESRSDTTVIIEEDVTEDEGPVRKRLKLNPEMQEAVVKSAHRVAEGEQSFVPKGYGYNKSRKLAVAPKKEIASGDLPMDTCVVSSDFTVMKKLPAALTENVEGRELEAVQTVFEHNTGLIWLAKFSDRMRLELVPAALMNKYFPKTVIGFYERRLQFRTKTE